jgi:hypothetical protein
MISSVRRHLSYANVAATMALLFAMSGSALAADHFVASTATAKPKEFGYRITSITQISPNVQAQLKGAEKPGRAGPAGATGSQGPTGPFGAAGAPGVEGLRGVQGVPGVQGPSGMQGAPGEQSLSVLSKSEQETLKSILPYVKYVASGVGGKPTIQFSGANVQIVNGEGSTKTTNGAGNLIIGYDEGPGAQTGSHNVIVGPEDEYMSYGALIAGRDNRALSPDSFLAGIANKTSNEGASVSGGRLGTASGLYSSVTGGRGNIAGAGDSSVSGGAENKAEEDWSWVSGGEGNRTTGMTASISGGKENVAAFEFSSIFGGKELETKANYEAIP